MQRDATLWVGERENTTEQNKGIRCNRVIQSQSWLTAAKCRDFNGNLWVIGGVVVRNDSSQHLDESRFI